MITVDTIIQKRDNAVTAELDGLAVMMSIEKGNYYAFDEISTIIWDAIDKPVTFQDLVLNLLRKFDVSKEECEKDVSEFLNGLLEKGLIELQ
ncbi:MAG: lasso peptide biosynthesis PqqD family chaperone [Desulfosporosinus sp.]|nr:lasso peptide biosynthesis PqqD family chaperone [Desulfosporosinus sp.]